ncbi:hypothetical protein [Streptomyces chartreusis]
MHMDITEIVILGILAVFVAYHHPKLGAAIGVGVAVVALLVTFHPLA